jgi:beta-galactosidase
MKRILLAAALALAALTTQAQPPHHTFAIQGDHFALDGKPFKILSGELHYARIPREYWHARLKMARAMGLNTIATYVFWNVHEPAPGQYDFTGNNDLAAFIRAAHEEGLYVILRAGPYSCAEWDLGGLPPWLLADPTSAAALRSNDPAFIVPAERWIKRLAQEVAPLQLGRGGPILMTQVENEYGNYGSDQAYMQHLHEIFQSAGFTDSLLYSADNWRNISKGSIPELYAATNFGIGNHQGGMDALAKLRSDAPLFVSEYWPGWFDHWGHPHETRPIPPQLEDLDYILHRGAGINIYMFHGGTSFGFMAGSSNIANAFLPDVTSYDYDAPLDESGRPTPKFLAYRKVLAQFACPNKSAVILSEAKNPRISPEAPKTSGEVDDSCLPPIPATPPTIAIPTITLTSTESLWDNLPPPVSSEQLHPMEYFGQSYGYILYRTSLSADAVGVFHLGKPHDYARVYFDGHPIGSGFGFDRRSSAANFDFDLLLGEAPAGKTYQLDILVANDGRINSTRAMQEEVKGLVSPVIGRKGTLTNWQVYTLPMTSLPAASKFKPIDASAPPSGTPAFYRTTFSLQKTGDTFLDIRNLGKGALWINGHPIGRFWNVGPQQTLYVPGPWLRKGSNEIIVFDLMPTSATPHVAGLSTPILDGPVTDRTTSKQE